MRESSFPKMCLGVAVLMERQVRRTLGAEPERVGEVTALAIGLADRTAAAARHAMAMGKKAVGDGVKTISDPVATGRAVAGSAPVAWVTGPMRRMVTRAGDGVEDLVAHGRAVADSVSEDAAALLKAESDRAIAWARVNVVPPLIEDLAHDDAIRDLVFDQVYGAVSDAGRAAEGVAREADSRVEAGFQRLLRRGEPPASSGA
ncbi:hypothetical protein J5X84_29185 [Streptosporangiaceae bacterium NEAU-GS5]|nr:hypothetical protein [Streptosporangiaceae bacterium NEAU-GS5]